MIHQCRAAFTNELETYPLLFVNTGIAPTKSLEDQKDSFWESADLFDGMTQSYAPFGKVVRGFDPTHKGLNLNCIKATLDAGCGFGGSLIAAQMSSRGEFYEVLEV